MSTWKVAGETGTGRGASEGLTSPEFSAFLRAAQKSPQWNLYGQNRSTNLHCLVWKSKRKFGSNFWLIFLLKPFSFPQVARSQKKKPRAKLHLEFIKMLDSLCPYTLYMEIGVWCLESEIHLVGPARLEWNPGLENILSEVANNGKNNRWSLIIKITASSFLMYIWCDSWNRLCCSSEMHLY